MSQVTLQEVLDSKIYVKPSSVKFLSAREYLSPFLDHVSKHTDQFRVTVDAASQNMDQKEEGGQMNTAYGRVAVEAILPGFGTDETSGTIGMVFALDIQKPVVKVFSGQEVRVCMNLCIFRAEHCIQQDLLGGLDRIYKEAEKMAREKEEEVKLFRQYHERMQRGLTQHEVDQLMGRLLRNAEASKFNTGLLLEANRLLYTPGSKYLVSQTGEIITTEWQTYNSITQAITSKTGILERPTKTLILSDLFFKENDIARRN